LPGCDDAPVSDGSLIPREVKLIVIISMTKTTVPLLTDRDRDEGGYDALANMLSK